MEVNTILNFKIYSGKESDLRVSDNQQIINTINPHSYVVSRKDIVFKRALESSDILIPDGNGIVFAVKYLRAKKITRITGADLHLQMLMQLNLVGGSCFYLGASENTLVLIRERLIKDFPNVKFNSYSPPYKSSFSVEDNVKMIEEINKFSPDVLFVGMTAPKQEKWVYENKNLLKVKTICSIGAVFDFYAGTVNRAPQWIMNLYLEWFYRLINEPRRMWKRYLVNTFIFIYCVMKEKHTTINK